MAVAMNTIRVVVGRIPKFEDVEVHVSEVTAEGKRFFEIREYIPSLEAYGKGLTLPVSMLPAIREATDKVPYDG